ncbi:hypothetical protein AAMO2058_000617400, partial [Amorphochlora amoebiformis]
DARAIPHLQTLFHWADTTNTTLSATYINTRANTLADRLSRDITLTQAELAEMRLLLHSIRVTRHHTLHWVCTRGGHAPPTRTLHPKNKRTLFCLSPTQSGRSPSPPGPILGERHNRPPSPLASCPMVQQSRATIGQPPAPPIPGCHHPFTPICSLTPELGMDWGAALRQAEQKANVPKGVGTRFRIHHSTYRQYAGAWAALRTFAQNTQIPPTLLDIALQAKF